MSDEQLDRLLCRVPEAPVETPCVDDGELILYRRGSLSQERNDLIEGHVARCRACRALLVGLAQPVSKQAQARAEGAFDARRTIMFRRLAVGGGLGLAFVAGLAMFTLSQSVPPLPEYEIEGPLGGISSVRGAQSSSDSFALDGTIRVVLRPRAATKSAFRLGVLRIDADGRLVDVTGDDWSISAEGGARWSAPVTRALGNAAGRYRLAIVISTRDPKSWEGLELDAARRADAQAQWWTKEVVLVGDGNGE